MNDSTNITFVCSWNYATRLTDTVECNAFVVVVNKYIKITTRNFFLFDCNRARCQIVATVFDSSHVSNGWCSSAITFYRTTSATSVTVRFCQLNITDLYERSDSAVQYQTVGYTRLDYMTCFRNTHTINNDLHRTSCDWRGLIESAVLKFNWPAKKKRLESQGIVGKVSRAISYILTGDYEREWIGVISINRLVAGLGPYRKKTYQYVHSGHKARTTIGDRAFGIAAPRVWDSLAHVVQSSASLTAFLRSLKIELSDLVPILLDKLTIGEPHCASLMCPTEIAAHVRWTAF